MSYSRKKSCEQCRTAKTRCSLNLPKCTRCVARGFDCVWKGVFSEHPSGIPTQRSSQALESSFSFNNLTPPRAINTHGVPAATSNAYGNTTVHGNNGQATPGNTFDLFGAPLDAFMSGSYTANDDGESPGHNSHSGDSLDLFDPSDVQAFTSGNPRFMLPKTPKSIDALLTHKAVHGTLSSWPDMLVNGLRLPPFIHPPCYRTGTRECLGKGRHICFSTPLDNACGVVQMRQVTTRQSFHLLKTTGHYEQRRMLAEFEQYDKWTLLECFQTMALYVICFSLLTEYEIQFCDGSIVIAAALVGSKVIQEHGYLSEKEKNGGFPDWEDWIYSESIRRTMALLSILGRILEFRVGPSEQTVHDDSLDNIPLPASGQLWEANNRIDWERKYQEALRSKAGREVRKIGDLKSCRSPSFSQQNEAQSILIKDLELWCSDLDQFGTTVWMASSLTTE